MYIVNEKFRCTEPKIIRKYWYPRKPIQQLVFEIIEYVSAEEVDKLLLEPLSFRNIETESILTFCEFTEVQNVTIEYGKPTHIVLKKKEVRKYESNVCRSNG
jgi:hypothetical protein